MENSRKPLKVHTNDFSSKISCFVDTAMKKQISWNSLAFILDEMASTLDMSKQVIKVLLDILESVTANDALNLSENTKDNSIEIQKNAESEEIEFDDFDDSLPEIENDEIIENEELDINEAEMIESDDDIEEMNNDRSFGSEAEFEHEHKSEEELKKELNTEEPTERDLRKPESEKDNSDLEQVQAKEVDDKSQMAEEVKKEIDNSLVETNLDYTVITHFKLYEFGPKKGTGRWLINILAGPYTYGKKKIDESQRGLFHCQKCLSGHGMFEILFQ